jgi:hypothetical protein
MTASSSARTRIRVRPADQACAPSWHTPEHDTPEPRVGYCRPPREHQFKSGQSGNPKGRRKGSRNLATIIAEVLQRQIRTRIDGEPKRLLPTEALIHVVLRKALNGDRHAWQTVFTWIAEIETAKDRREALLSLSDKEAEILRRMQERFVHSEDQ